MTPKLRQICGCELCIISKYTQIYLNRFRIILITDLQHNYVGIHTINILFIPTRAVYLHILEVDPWTQTLNLADIGTFAVSLLMYALIENQIK